VQETLLRGQWHGELSSQELSDCRANQLPYVSA